MRRTAAQIQEMIRAYRETNPGGSRLEAARALRIDLSVVNRQWGKTAPAPAAEAEKSVPEEPPVPEEPSAVESVSTLEEPVSKEPAPVPEEPPVAEPAPPVPEEPVADDAEPAPVPETAEVQPAPEEPPAVEEPAPEEPPVVEEPAPVSEEPPAVEKPAAEKRGFFARFGRKGKPAAAGGKEQRKNDNRKPDLKNGNPYLSARARYSDRFRALSIMNLYLKILVGVCVLMVLGCFGYSIQLGNRSRIVPYVITVDDHGLAMGTGFAKEALEPDSKVVVAALTGFIARLRTVTVDVQYLKKQFVSVYSMIDVNDPAYRKVNEFLSGGDPDTGGLNPYARAANEVVHLAFVSAVPLTAQTMQIEWTETARGRDGQKLRPTQAMRGIVTWYRGEVENDIEAVSNNPFGIFVKDFNWTVLHT